MVGTGNTIGCYLVRAYSKFFELLKSRCLKLGIKVIEVSPKYSSQIGVTKYMRRYGMGSDSAAGLVLARRGMGIYYEKLPARYHDAESS